MRKVLAVFLTVCILCNTYGSNVFAAGNSLMETEINAFAGTTEDGTAAEDSADSSIEKSEDSDEEEGGVEDTGSKKGDGIEDTNSENGTGQDANSEEELDESEGIDSEGQTDEDDENENGGENTADGMLTDEDSSEDVEDAREELLFMENSALYATASGEVSRIEWLEALVDIFEMTVTEDNYPDNYYSDVDSSSEHYHTIMLATEFGLVDVEAGDALCPNEPATREFAAHTLNFCLGFMPSEVGSYTFSESAEAAYPDDIQIAINRGWFKLSNGKFMPDAGITAIEKTTMLTDAHTVLAEQAMRPNHSNSYQFADDVIVLPEDTEAELTDDNEITIYNLSVPLKTGDKFALITDGFPVMK